MTRRSQRQQKKAEVAATTTTTKATDGDGGSSSAGGDEAENVFEIESVTGGEGSEGKISILILIAVCKRNGQIRNPEGIFFALNVIVTAAPSTLNSGDSCSI